MERLTKEDIEKELVGSKAALEAHTKGSLIHEIVIKAFEKELKKYEKSV